jgi:hypothetical protein
VTYREDEKLIDWQNHSTTANSEWHSAVAHASVVLALNKLTEDHQNCLAGLVPTIAPLKSRCVRASRDFPIGGVVLVPLTHSIMLKGVGQATLHGAVVIPNAYKHVQTQQFMNAVLLQSGGLKLPTKFECDKSTRIGALKDKAQPLIVLYWLVGHAESNKHGNMVQMMMVVNDLSIPCLTSDRVIKSGDELRVHKEPLPTTEKHNVSENDARKVPTKQESAAKKKAKTK